MASVYKKELYLFFVTMPGYVFVFIMLLAIGAGCMAYNLIAGNSTFQNVLSFMSLFLIFAVPILTMRTFSEEKRQRTDQLLRALPLRSREVVLGKYFALLTVLAVPIGIACFYPLILTMYGTVDLRTSYSAILALYFLGAALCAIGMFLSSFTENQLVSAILSFGVLFLCYEAGSISTVFSPGALASYRAFLVVILLIAVFILLMTKNAWAALISAVVCVIPLFALYKWNMGFVAGKFNVVIAQFALFDKMKGFIQGIFDLTALLYYISVAVLFLIFTVKVFEKRN